MSGSLAAGTEYAVFLLLHHVGLLLIAANVLSFSCGLAISFLLNKHWVFSRKGGVTKQFIIYAILAAVNVCISSGLIIAFVDHLNVPALIAKIIVMGMIACWNYVIFRNVIFKAG